MELLNPPMPAAEFWTCDRRILANVDWYWSQPIGGVEYVTGVQWKDRMEEDGPPRIVQDAGGVAATKERHGTG